MPKKSRKNSHKGKRSRTMKQKIINMIGCSKKHKHNKSCKKSKDLGCPNCNCKSNSKCAHNCSYQTRIKKGGSSGDPVGGLTYKQMNTFGGNCGGTCGLQQMGGNASPIPASLIPGPFVGSSWGNSVNEWPGMNGIGSDRNYLNSYAKSIGNDPQLKMSMADAGYKTPNSMIGGKNKKRRSQSGGGLIPQDLLNLGRNFTFNLHSAYNSLNGYNQPVNPMPYKDQLPRSINNKIML